MLMFCDAASSPMLMIPPDELIDRVEAASMSKVPVETLIVEAPPAVTSKPPEPVLMSTPVVAVPLPIVMARAEAPVPMSIAPLLASLPIEIAPLVLFSSTPSTPSTNTDPVVEVLRSRLPLVTTNSELPTAVIDAAPRALTSKPAVPVSIWTSVAPVALPTVMTRAAAPVPILMFCESLSLPMLITPAEFKDKSLSASMSRRPAESTASVPLVMVEIVRSAAVVETFDAEEPSIENPTTSAPDGATSNGPSVAVMAMVFPPSYAPWRSVTPPPPAPSSSQLLLNEAFVPPAA